MDGMETSIASKSQKTALIFTSACMAVWCVYILAVIGPVNLAASLPFLLLLAVNLVQFWSVSILKWKNNSGIVNEK